MLDTSFSQGQLMALQASNLYPVFSMKAVKNEVKSAQEGREIFEEQEYVTIHIKGDQLTVVDKPVKNLSEEQRQLFRPVYDHWKATREQKPVTGEPLEGVAWLNTAQVATLRAMHVFTVEDLAGLSDQAIGKIGMGGRELVEKAKARVLTAKDSAIVNRIIEEGAAKDAEIKRLTDQYEDLKRRLDALQAIQSEEKPKRK